MYYYFKVDKFLRLIPFSNFSSKRLVKDRWAVPYVPASDTCCDENATVDSQFETLQNPKEKWVVRLDASGRPVNSTLMRYQSGMNLNNLQFVPIPTCCPQLQPPVIGAITNSSGQSSIAFTNAVGATDNIWEYSLSPSFTSPTQVNDFTTPLVIGSLTNGTTYYLRGRSTDGTVLSPWTTTAILSPVVGVLNPPTSLTVTNGDSSASVAWTAATNATSTFWQVSADNFVTILQSGTDATSPTPISGLTNGSTVRFRNKSTAPTYADSVYSTPVTINPTAAPSPQVFYGNKGTGTDLNQSQIEAGTNVVYVPGLDISIPYFTSSPTFHWVAWPTSETGITNYYVNSLDFGTFGGGSPWNDIVVVGSYNFLINAYATQYPSPEPVQFKH